MEPAYERRENGSQDSSRVTCADGELCERRAKAWRRDLLCGLVKVQEWSLTCMRALPGIRVTTSALANQMMTALDVGSFSW
jgi:hypothetical protein